MKTLRRKLFLERLEDRQLMTVAAPIDFAGSGLSLEQYLVTIHWWGPLAPGMQGSATLFTGGNQFTMSEGECEGDDCPPPEDPPPDPPVCGDGESDDPDTEEVECVPPPPPSDPPICGDGESDDPDTEVVECTPPPPPTDPPICGDGESDDPDTETVECVPPPEDHEEPQLITESPDISITPTCGDGESDDPDTEAVECRPPPAPDVWVCLPGYDEDDPLTDIKECRPPDPSGLVSAQIFVVRDKWEETHDKLLGDDTNNAATAGVAWSKLIVETLVTDVRNRNFAWETAPHDPTDAAYLAASGKMATLLRKADRFVANGQITYAAANEALNYSDLALGNATYLNNIGAPSYAASINENASDWLYRSMTNMDLAKTAFSDALDEIRILNATLKALGY